MVLSCFQVDRCLPAVLARVFVARFADALRARAGRRRATCFACRDSAFGEAADLDSLFSAAFAARDRFGEGRLPVRRAALLALRFVRSLALFGGAGSFTPARRALDSPIAMACLVERAPCLPSRTCSISSSTKAPACVDGAFPARFARRAFSSVSFSGIWFPPLDPKQIRGRQGRPERVLTPAPGDRPRQPRPLRCIASPIGRQRPATPLRRSRSPRSIPSFR